LQTTGWTDLRLTEISRFVKTILKATLTTKITGETTLRPRITGGRMLVATILADMIMIMSLREATDNVTTEVKDSVTTEATNNVTTETIDESIMIDMTCTSTKMDTEITKMITAMKEGITGTG
jgi:hypothetical protein